MIADMAGMFLAVIGALNTLSPLGLAGLMGFILYHMVAKKGSVKTLSENHLSGLPDILVTLQSIDGSSKRQEALLGEIRDDLSETAKGVEYLKGRADGRA